MPSTLRRIAVYVDEPADRDFRWVLMEQQGDEAGAWAEVRRASSAASTYQRAMADGLLALQALVDDLDSGPRQTQRASRHAKARDSEEDSEAGDAPGKSSFFGFGPAT